jgi:precorrin-6A/cobalt-precorrin-6A reductase
VSPSESGRLRLLLLGGTGEARELAGRLAGDPRFAVVTSLAGRTETPALPPGAVRIGGFGGEDGFARYLEGERIDAVLDATHPFARRISQTAYRVCLRLNRPYLRLERPAWQPEAGDHWLEVPDLDSGLKLACRTAATLFASIGRPQWPHLLAYRHCRFIVRTIDPIVPPAAHILPVAGRPPYTVAGDRDLLLRFHVEALLVRNAGGAGAKPKLIAARSLGLPVVMIRRPPLAVAPVVADLDAAQLWLEGLLRGRSR